ncbi:hypothetical protein [Corynebacterium coyleae]|uniref:hypothetical protein n=1 Tax=Corynebacterium coyleae TaxID=53374 RepID=UPI00254E2F96|nr:hypothetical protein [Corynebacterium coyleae]MDK8242583.1 hypothetical protein [Corynebacterium coyleae]
MSGAKVKLDIKALSKAARKELSSQVAAKGSAIRDAAASQVPDDVPVGMMMKEDKMGSPVALVTIMHPAGLALQARAGVLTRAAASSGLDVTRGGQ